MKSGFTIDRSLRIRDKYRRIVLEIVSQARHCHMSHRWMLDQREHRINSQLDYEDAPQWVQSYIEATWSAQCDALYWHDIVWCHFLDGKYIPTDEVRARISEVDPNLSRHVWTGTQSVFFEPSSKAEEVAS